jgi:hypothetical protein
MKILILAILVTIFTACGSRQSNCDNVKSTNFYEKCRKLVLSEKVPGQEFSFSRNGDEIDEITVTYLGYITNTKGDTLRILNSVNYTGKLAGARRGNGKVYIYDSKDKRIGFYYVGSAMAIPSKIENGNLIFNSQYDNCNQTTRISLIDSIPNKIFINCNNEGGDLYEFETSDE